MLQCPIAVGIAVARDFVVLGDIQTAGDPFHVVGLGQVVDDYFTRIGQTIAIPIGQTNDPICRSLGDVEHTVGADRHQAWASQARGERAHLEAGRHVQPRGGLVGRRERRCAGAGWRHCPAAVSLVAQQTKQDIVGRLVRGVQLEARALEPLDGKHPIRRIFGLCIAQGHAEQQQALGLAPAWRAVELKAAGAPGPQERVADVMAGGGEEAAAVLWLRLWEGRPVAAALPKAVGTEAAKQDIVGLAVFGVQLQAHALEPLRLEHPALDRLGLLRADREAEDRQAAVPLPVCTDAASDTEAGRGEAAFAGLGTTVAR